MGWLINAQQTNPVPFAYNPDESGYDWRAAKTAGAVPQMYFDALPHWPSEFKTNTHANLWGPYGPDGSWINTNTGEPLTPNYKYNRGK